MNSPEHLRDRLLAIMAADVAGYSRMMSTDGRATLAELDRAREIFRRRIAAQGGRVIDMAGDSVLAVFETAASAVQSALAVQQELAQRAFETGIPGRMQFRIGVHIGDVLEKPDGTVYGDGVNIAARLESLASPGGVAISSAVHDLVSRRMTVDFQDLGEQRVKNIEHPVRAWGLGALKIGEPAGAPEAGAAQAGTWLVRRRLFAVAAAVLLVGLPWGALRWWPMTSAPTPRASADPGLRTGATALSVRPFSTVDELPDSKRLAVSLQQGVISLLSGVGSLQVLAGDAIPPGPEKKNGLYRVEGTVRTSGPLARVSAYLRRESDGLTLWTETFDRANTDSRQVQDEVAYRVAKAIEAKLRDDSPAARGTHHEEAWALLQQASTLDRERAEPLLQRALKLDPAFARARVMLAEKFLEELLEGGEERPSDSELVRNARARIETEIQAALVASPQLVSAHLLKARFDGDLNNDRTLAFDGVRRALLIAPSDWSAHAHAARLYLQEAQMEEALNELKQAAELAPTAIDRRWSYAVALRWAGRLPEALEQIERAVTVDPGDATYRVEHARILLDLGRRDEAERIVLRLSHTVGYRTLFILGQTGHRAELEAVARDPRVASEDKAFAHLMLGNRKPMLAELARGGRPRGVNYKLWDSSFDSLRDTPEFRAWLERHQLTSVHQRAQDWRASRLRTTPPR